MKAEPYELLLAFGGGLLIFAATTFNLLMKGRITGMSGLLSGVVGDDGSRWKISILSGMGITSCVFWLIFKFEPVNEGKTFIFTPPQALVSGLDVFGFALAGLLVGIGTKLGNGCTSGHGVCGLPRLSLRSFVAVVVFMLFGIGFASLRFYYPFLEENDGLNVIKKIDYNFVVPLVLSFISVFYVGYIFYLHRKNEIAEKNDLVISFFTGVLFASGLIVSGMIKREKVLGFLTIYEDWDPSLAIVFASATLPNFLSFHFILKREKPLYSLAFEVPANTKVDFKLVAGAAIFGIGWGFAGLCPGPAYVITPILNPHISVIFILSLLMGFFLTTKVLEDHNPQPEQNTYQYQYQSQFELTTSKRR